MSEMKLPRITPGKPGSSSEGRFFLVTFEGHDAARELIMETGAVHAGGKGDVTLWILPVGTDEQGANHILQRVRDHLAPTPEAADPVEPHAVTEEPDANPAETAADAVTSEAEGAGTREEPEIEPGATVLEVSDTTGVEADPEAGEGGPEATAAIASRASSATDEPIFHGFRTGMSVAEWDQYRHPVPEGSVAVGDCVEMRGETREIVMLSGPLHASADMIKDLEKRFPNAGIAPDATFRFAIWAAEPELAPEPSM